MVKYRCEPILTFVNFVTNLFSNISKWMLSFCQWPFKLNAHINFSFVNNRNLNLFQLTYQNLAVITQCNTDVKFFTLGRVFSLRKICFPDDCGALVPFVINLWNIFRTNFIVWGIWEILFSFLEPKVALSLHVRRRKSYFRNLRMKSLICT